MICSFRLLETAFALRYQYQASGLASLPSRRMAWLAGPAVLERRMQEVLMVHIVVRVIQAGTCDVQTARLRRVIVRPGP